MLLPLFISRYFTRSIIYKKHKMVLVKFLLDVKNRLAIFLKPKKALRNETSQNKLTDVIDVLKISKLVCA